MPRSKEEKTTTSVIQRKLASKAAAIVWADAPYIKKFAGAVRQFFHALNCTRIQKLFFPGFWDWTPDTMIPVSLLNLRLSSRNKWSEIDKNISSEWWLGLFRLCWPGHGATCEQTGYR